MATTLPMSDLCHSENFAQKCAFFRESLRWARDVQVSDDYLCAWGRKDIEQRVLEPMKALCNSLYEEACGGLEPEIRSALGREEEIPFGRFDADSVLYHLGFYCSVVENRARVLAELNFTSHADFFMRRCRAAARLLDPYMGWRAVEKVRKARRDEAGGCQSDSSDYSVAADYYEEWAHVRKLHKPERAAAIIQRAHNLRRKAHNLRLEAHNLRLKAHGLRRTHTATVR